jgi:hypothetical protein
VLLGFPSCLSRSFCFRGALCRSLPCSFPARLGAKFCFSQRGNFHCLHRCSRDNISLTDFLPSPALAICFATDCSCFSQRRTPIFSCQRFSSADVFDFSIVSLSRSDPVLFPARGHFPSRVCCSKFHFSRCRSRSPVQSRAVKISRSAHSVSVCLDHALAFPVRFLHRFSCS